MFYRTLMLLTVLLTVSCGKNHKDIDNTLIVSIPPLKYLVESIVDDDFAIEVLLPAGASPETYEPTPVQMVSVENSLMVFNTGLIAFEQNIIAKINANNAENKCIDLSNGIDLITGNCSSVHNDSHIHGVDPHIWTSPKNLKIMAANAFKAISECYPDSIEYKVNYEALMADLEALDSIVEIRLHDSRTDCFVVFHPALTYYARDYNLEQIAVEQDGKEPSAESLRKLVEKLRNKNVAYIFYQKEFPRSTVDILAAEIGIQAVEMNILDEDITACILHVTDLIAGE